MTKFDSGYPRAGDRILTRIEMDVIGFDGADGYTTMDQAAHLAEALRLGRDSRLLDIGSGGGWPSLRLARTTGCHAVLTDPSFGALRHAQRHARRASLQSNVHFAVADAERLPFRAGSCDAIVHTDVL